MLIRIVKLTLQNDVIPDFIASFEEKKKIILQFEGCHHLELWQEQKNPNVVFTHSHWENEDCLNAYRASDFFKATWASLKPTFTDKPAAWSVDKVG